jgi:hypothetical protein
MLHSAVRKAATGVAIILAGYATVILALALLHHKPPAGSSLAIAGNGRLGRWPDRLNLLTWNLGCAGTGEESDFFMDGGNDVLAKDRATVLKHSHNILGTLQQRSEDVYLLQEVDLESRRAYHINEVELITNGLKNLSYSFALNHDVWFVPYPFTRPMGGVRSGLLSMGTYRPMEASRIQLPGSALWPILINLHLSAWDKSGALREQELIFLREFGMKEYSEGNYVVIGGDWNSALPGVRLDQFPSEDRPGPYLISLRPEVFPGDWHWGVVTSHATNRRANAPYKPGKTYVTVIDGFLVSPNVQIQSVEVIPLNFRGLYSRICGRTQYSS